MRSLRCPVCKGRLTTVATEVVMNVATVAMKKRTGDGSTTKIAAAAAVAAVAPREAEKSRSN